jgi:hypothetical protein
MFAQDAGALRDILLGLSGGVMTGRVLEMDYDAQAVLLRDA